MSATRCATRVALPRAARQVAAESRAEPSTAWGMAPLSHTHGVEPHAELHAGPQPRVMSHASEPRAEPPLATQSRTQSLTPSHPPPGV